MREPEIVSETPAVFDPDRRNASTRPRRARPVRAGTNGGRAAASARTGARTGRDPAGWVVGISLLVLCLAVLVEPLPAAEPADLLSAIRSPTLTPDAAVRVENVELELGPAVVEIERGLLVPAAPVQGRTVELVFVGQARFRLDAPDEIEAEQLRLFTGEHFLAAPLETAVIVLADRNVMATLLEGVPSPPDADELERALSIHRRWLEEAERRAAGIESALFKLLIEDAVFRHYFALWGHSSELGDFMFHLDPEEQEPITLASFRQIELSNWERMRMRHQLRVQQRKGRWLNVRVEDLGSWDVWMSTAWSPDQGPPLPGNVGFEAEHYDLDVTLVKGDLQLDGRARCDLKVVTGGRRVVSMELMRDLLVSRVVDGEGRDLFFFQSGDELDVLLPAPKTAGERFRLEVSYRGKALEWAGHRTYDLRDTSLWYPHCGTRDRATYDVTLRWPKRIDVLFGGRLVERGRDGPYVRERRRLEEPAIAVSFAVGKYVVEHAQAGDTAIRLALGLRPGNRVTPGLREHMIRVVEDVLQYFEQAFGDYPLDELTVATVPRRFSQSYLGFVTLADSLTRDPDPVGRAATWRRNTTIAHELAHQWWGNAIGWRSYRDQWLSESLANYSALLYEAGRSGSDDLLSIMSSGWRESLGRTTLEGRTIESLGPVVLGSRLDSSRGRNGYRTIVYRKGAAVLAMLARAVGPEHFLEMLHSLAATAPDGVLTTETFLESMERKSGLDLEAFAARYIFGTGIPDVYYGYDLRPAAAGGWAVEGRAEVRFAPRYRYEIVHADGTWDARRRPRSPSPRATALMVPYRITVAAEPAGPAEAPAVDRREASHLRTGQLVLRGHEGRFRIETDRRPLELRLDPRGEILASFTSAERNPKRFLRHQAETLAAEGALERAEERYLEALRSPAAAGFRGELSSGPSSRDDPGRSENVRIRFALARLYLDQGRAEQAGAALDRIDRDLDDRERRLFRMQRDALRSRMDILRGDYGSAYRRLKKSLRLASPRRSRVPWRNLVLQMQLNAERTAVTEAYSLLAIAAHETGQNGILEWALEEADERGVDVSQLERAARRDLRGGSRAAAGAAALTPAGPDYNRRRDSAPPDTENR